MEKNIRTLGKKDKSEKTLLVMKVIIRQIIVCASESCPFYMLVISHSFHVRILQTAVIITESAGSSQSLQRLNYPCSPTNSISVHDAQAAALEGATDKTTQESYLHEDTR